MKAGQCRGCRSSRLQTLHDFGPQPLAGHYPEVPESVTPAERFPLDFSACMNCGLLQILNAPPIDKVFHADYRYSSSTVPGLVAHFDEYARWLLNRLPAGAAVFEFGCNDGVLLERLKAGGTRCAGVDASDNVAEIARQKQLDVGTGFLTEEYVRSQGLAGRQDAVTCSNVLAHIHELREVLAAVYLLLKEGGRFFVEVHDSALILENNQFDTIYHEHLTYFTAATLAGLLDASGFETLECLRTSMHGGGLRCTARKTARHDRSGSAAESPAVASAPSGSVGMAVARCRGQLLKLANRHGQLVGYGAAGRAQMFMSFTGSGTLFSRVYDDSPFRQGRFIVGTDVPILPYSGEPAACIVVLAWNYAADISKKVSATTGNVVTLLPELRSW